MRTKHLYLIWFAAILVLGVASQAHVLFIIAAAAIVPTIDWVLKKL